MPDTKNTGEIVLIYQQGWAPKKRPHPSFPRIPKLYPMPRSTVAARLEIENGPKEKSEIIFSVEETAIKELEDLYAELIAKRAAGIAAKAVVADQIRQKNQLLGDLAWIGMNVADQADLRQWTSLPATFQIAKIRLKPGHYKVRVVGINRAGGETGEATPVAGNRSARPPKNLPQLALRPLRFQVPFASTPCQNVWF